MKKLKFVEVEWFDTVSIASWRGVDHLPEPARCVSRGWLVKETDKYVVTAGTIMFREDGSVYEVSDLSAVPKAGMGFKVRRLKV